ncbi:hypothetical protein ACQCSX_22050 (plasmid) [Pseudarthrobacter sp. P1]|uniref:hypothetical protein n=1 Tax=Pseudarthrobacter sp. P1 TaxID=3418418 RepID=UPI003CF4786C
MYQPRQPQGIRTGGRFATTVRTEPATSLHPAQVTAGRYRRYTKNGMSQHEQRARSRRLVQETYDSGQLGRMAGTLHAGHAAAVLAASQRDDVLDAAIHAVVIDEQRNPGLARPETLGFLLSRKLLLAHRGAA